MPCVRAASVMRSPAHAILAEDIEFSLLRIQIFFIDCCGRPVNRTLQDDFTPRLELSLHEYMQIRRRSKCCRQSQC
jgi:hypothetical protein